MILNLRGRALDNFEEALRGESLELRVEVTVRDQNEKSIATLSADGNSDRAKKRRVAGILSGQVDADMTADVTHQLRLEVLDPEGRLQFSKSGPNTLYVDHYISVVNSYWVPRSNEWIDVPTFYGPISRWERSGAVVSVEALGKESLSLDPCFADRVIRIEKGSTVSEACEKLLKTQGETKFDHPEINAKVDRDITVSPKKEPWRIAKRLAHSDDLQSFYDTRGRHRLRRWPSDVRFIFK